MWLAMSAIGLIQPVSAQIAIAPTVAGPPKAACGHTVGSQLAHCVSVGSDTIEVALPNGTSPCPDSGGAVTCDRSNSEAADAGFSSTPNRLTGCGAELGLGSAGSVAACTDAVLAPASPPSPGATTGVAPSVELSTQAPTNATGRLRLATNSTVVARGSNVILTATSDSSVAGTGQSIEIFDTTTHNLLGACSEGSQCVVAYQAHSGKHAFSAYLTSPTTKIPAASSTVASNEVAVNWVGVGLSADRSAAGPGHPIALKATSSIAVDKTNWQLQIYDAGSGERIAYCSSGNICRTNITSSVARSIPMIAMLAPASSTIPSNAVIARSDLMQATWLSVAVSAMTNDAKAGSVVHVVATVNGDITGTGWSIGIFDQRGRMVGPVCNTGTTCRADVTMGSSLPSFRAAVGAVPSSKGGTFINGLVRTVTPPPSMTDIQAQSALVATTVRPKILWGVDSCESLTEDPGATTGLYPQVASSLGAPDFWGRYLTYTVCPGISPAEISAAHNHNMGLLPIYNDYDCSAVVGYNTGRQYGAEAVAAAHSLGIPAGVALAIDIEAPGAACPGAGNVDAGFVNGWYDGVTSANYVAAYYGNGTAGSPFANAYCSAVNGRPELGNNSHLWSYEPSLNGGFNKGSAPDMGLVANAKCPEHGTAWQFVLSAGSDPDVDQDLVNSDFPLWYP